MIYSSTHPAVEIPEGSLHDQILVAMDARGSAAAPPGCSSPATVQVRWSASPLLPAPSG